MRGVHAGDEETGSSLQPSKEERGSCLQPSLSPAHPIISFWRRSQEKSRYGETATQPSVFDDPHTAAYYTPPPTYENAHRFDPDYRWTWGEELALVAKLDIKVTLWSLVLFIIVEINKSNLRQANSDNFLDDIGIDTDDYNTGNSIFRITALVATLPVQLLSRKVGM